MDIRYSYGILGEGVQKLTVHPGRVKERLAEAANILVAVDHKIFDEKGMIDGAADYWKTIWTTITTAPEMKSAGYLRPRLTSYPRNKSRTSRS